MSDPETESDLVDPEGGPEAVRPIRALLRGLEALHEMNGRIGATVTDIARAIKLPRTTAYRVLETLCVAGYVVRDPADDRYRLTLNVRSLADGLEDEPWVSAAARPVLAKAAKEQAWPLAVGTLYGTSLLMRESSGRVARASLLESSAGRVFLAHCPDEQRSTLLDVLSRSARADKDQFNRILAETRNNGWAIHDDVAALELDLAVPVIVRTRILAVLTMRYTRSAISADQAIEKYVPILKRIAEDIAKAFEALTPP